MSQETRKTSRFSNLWLKEDYWAVWIGLGTILIALLIYKLGGNIGPLGVKFEAFDSFSVVPGQLAGLIPQLILLYVVLAIIFAVAIKIMGHSIPQFLKGFTLLYVMAIIVQILGSWNPAKALNLEAPVLALIIGMLIGNFVKIPAWFDAALRTEFYVKIGIVLMGATLPFTLILSSGPVAFLQATFIAVTTFLTIYFVGTRIFGLDKRFAATLGAGGSICGVSASIAIGSSVNAEKNHVSISISMVVVWATIMVFFLPIMSHLLGLTPGEAGAWIGTSEFADAAGIAAAAQFGDAGITSFTLMKVVGRDMFVGIWAFILAIISVTKWETHEGGVKPGAGVIWERFPKFVLGFFIASFIMTAVTVGITPEVNDAINAAIIGPIKSLRTWSFVFCFLCIGLTTRFKELASVGMKPVGAFSIGVLVNVILGFLFSVLILGHYWTNITQVFAG